jgi:dolichol-phosphate mannosyltransferase
MADAPFLSVVVPVHDEEESLELLHQEIARALASVGGGYELLFVDDGSRDGSLAILREIALADPHVRLIRLDRCYGQSAAFAAGFQRARGEVVATLDADLQNDPADLPRLLARLDEGDVVNGVRVDRRDGWVRRISSRVANGFRNWATGESVSDVGCSLRVMRADLLRRVRLYRGMHRFLPTLLRLEGARVIEVPVSHRQRSFGRSKYGIRNRLFTGLVDVFAVRWMQSRALRYRAEELGPSEQATLSGS